MNTTIYLINPATFKIETVKISNNTPEEKLNSIFIDPYGWWLDEYGARQMIRILKNKL